MDEFDNFLSDNEKGSFRGCEGNIIVFMWLWLQVLAHWKYWKQMNLGSSVKQLVNQDVGVWEHVWYNGNNFKFVSKQTFFKKSLIGCKQDILYILVTLFLFENTKK